MAKLPRVFQKIFGGNASNNGQFGSAAIGTKILSNDLPTLMALQAYIDGWSDAVLSGERLPTLEEMQALSYIETTQLSYIFQEGVSEYDASTTYYQHSIVKKVGTYQLYGSLTNDNTGNALTDGTNWLFLTDLSSPVGTISANSALANNTTGTAAPVGIALSVSQLLGRGSTGNVAPIILGTNLSMSGTTLNAAASTPTGVMFDFAGTTAPTGYLGCDGSAVSRTTYAALFTAIGTTWGVGDGSTTFNIPDFRRRVAVGSGGSGSGILGNAVGNTGGEETHAMTLSELFAHTHSIGAGSASNNHYTTGNSTGTNSTTGAVNNTAADTSGSAGGSTPFNVMQPSAVVLKIIKT